MAARLIIACLLTSLLAIPPFDPAKADDNPAPAAAEPAKKESHDTSVTSDIFTALIESLHQSVTESYVPLSASNADNDILRVTPSPANSREQENGPAEPPFAVTNEPYAPHGLPQGYATGQSRVVEQEPLPTIAPPPENKDVSHHASVIQQLTPPPIPPQKAEAPQAQQPAQPSSEIPVLTPEPAKPNLPEKADNDQANPIPPKSGIRLLAPSTPPVAASSEIPLLESKPVPTENTASEQPPVLNTEPSRETAAAPLSNSSNNVDTGEKSLLMQAMEQLVTTSGRVLSEIAPPENAQQPSETVQQPPETLQPPKPEKTDLMPPLTITDEPLAKGYSSEPVEPPHLETAVKQTAPSQEPPTLTAPAKTAESQEKKTVAEVKEKPVPSAPAKKTARSLKHPLAKAKKKPIPVSPTKETESPETHLLAETKETPAPASLAEETVNLDKQALTDNKETLPPIAPAKEMESSETHPLAETEGMPISLIPPKEMQNAENHPLAELKETAVPKPPENCAETTPPELRIQQAEPAQTESSSPLTVVNEPQPQEQPSAKIVTAAPPQETPAAATTETSTGKAAKAEEKPGIIIGKIMAPTIEVFGIDSETPTMTEHKTATNEPTPTQAAIPETTPAISAETIPVVEPTTESAKPSVEVFESALNDLKPDRQPWENQPPVRTKPSIMNREGMYLEASQNYPGQPFANYARHNTTKKDPPPSDSSSFWP